MSLFVVAVDVLLRGLDGVVRDLKGKVHVERSARGRAIGDYIKGGVGV